MWPCVSSPAMPRPSHRTFVDAEIVGERALDLLRGKAGIAGLHGAEQALLGGQQESGAVDVDAAAFEHQAGTPSPHLEALRERGGHGVVLLPVVVLGPSVEAPIGDGDFVPRILDEQRAVVAGPDAVGGAADELDGVQIGAGLGQLAAGVLFERFVLHQDADALDSRQLAHDLAIHPGDGRELAGPVVAIVRPGEDGGLVRLPLRGHAEAQAARGVGHQSLNLLRIGE